MAKNSKKSLIPVVNENLYIHRCVGSDRYCFKVTQISLDGKTVVVLPVYGSGLEGNEDPHIPENAKPRTFFWKYNAWREYEINDFGEVSNKIITRRMKFSGYPNPYLDPSF